MALRACSVARWMKHAARAHRAAPCRSHSHAPAAVRGFATVPPSVPLPDGVLVVVTKTHGVTTIRMNNPKRLNGWTQPMMTGMLQALADAAADPETKVAVLTGTDPYYCAGVNLSDTIKPMHPRKLFRLIEEKNRVLFDTFLEFPKPIIAAVNGPAIGASVTSATLCDAIIASERATFSTPFAKLGIPPEGCSSVHFARIMGEEAAARMLGPEGWVPTAAEAHEVGMVSQVAPHDTLMEEVQAVAEEWAVEVEAGTRQRSLVEQGRVEELKAVNAKESRALAEAFLSRPFLEAQHEFLKSKGKDKPAALFNLLAKLHPVWSRLL